MTLEVETLTDPAAMGRDLPSYARLLESSSDGSVFLRIEWLEAWWTHYGKGRLLQAIEVREGGRLVGYGLFMETELGKLIKIRKLEFVGAGHSDILGIVAENDRVEVIEAVLDQVIEGSTWDIAEFRDVRQYGPTASRVLERFPFAEVSKENSPCIAVRPSFQDYLSGLSQNARHNMVRTCRKTLDELGASFVRIAEQDSLPIALEEFFRLHEMRWSQKEEDSVLSAQMRDFLRDAIRRLAQSGIPVIHALKTGDKTISMCLGFEYRNRYQYYLSGFDPAYLRYSPGRCLLSKIIEEAHERRLKEVDLLRGDEEYKYHLGAENRSNLVVKVRRPSMKTRILDKMI
jgi:CelD/BcsL family acetyltransferase involved in cellulose biosynthesis